MVPLETKTRRAGIEDKEALITRRGFFHLSLSAPAPKRETPYIIGFLTSVCRVRAQGDYKSFTVLQRFI